MAAKKRVSKDVTTPIGILSFPRVFEDTKEVNKKTGKISYNIQILVPKSDKAGCRALIAALKEVGVGNYGDNWRQFKIPLRDGDKEASIPTDDGSTRGEKYPERAGHYFINASSSKPVGVFDRSRSPITDSNALYGGCKGKINITFYPFNTDGNIGIAAGLNGVQKIADGEPFGGGKPAVESMFDILDEDDDEGLGDPEDDDLDDEEEEVEEAPAPKRRAAKKTTPAAKKAATRRRKPEPEPEPEDDEDDEDDLYEEDDYDDLDADGDDDI